jgi:hypothetical protein
MEFSNTKKMMMLKETPVMPQKFKKKEAPINLEIDDMPPRVEGV